MATLFPESVTRLQATAFVDNAELRARVAELDAIIQTMHRDNSTLTARVSELEARLNDMLTAEPDRHKESMAYFEPHKTGCVWCAARRALNP